MPYRLYVPLSYDPNVDSALIVALHGYGGNQNYFFDIVKELPALCEQYGIILVAPMGFATDGWYGAPLIVPGAAPRSGGGATPTTGRSPDDETRYRALSEQDVFNVLEIVKREYTIDSRRTYLMGHSMGGFGTWWLGQKYATTWAAIAPMSGVLPNVDYQLPKLEGVPVDGLHRRSGEPGLGRGKPQAGRHTEGHGHYHGLLRARGRDSWRHDRAHDAAGLRVPGEAKKEPVNRR